MERRRVNFQIGVVYETKVEDLERIPALIGDIVRSIDNAIFDRAHFSSFGESSLVFDVVYFVATSDYLRYMDIQQEINLRLMGEFEKKGIGFALPTQAVHIKE